jgi:hypothetical protein
LKQLTRKNVLDDITDQTSVLYLQDQDIINRINFLLDPIQALDPDWFRSEVFNIYTLWIYVANKKHLFSQKMSGNDSSHSNLPVDYLKPGPNRDGLYGIEMD